MGVSAIEPRVRITGAASQAPAAPRAGEGERSIAVPMDDFTRKAAAEESARLGVSVEELVAFAVLYYLADVDSGRIARQILGRPRRSGDRAP